MGTAVTYKTSAETAGVANRDLANLRFANTGTITHYYDDQTGSLTPTGTATYTVNAGDPLLQNRFSLAKIAWLTQSWVGEPDPGTTAPGYASSNYPAAIQACFGLVWGAPGSTSTNGNTSTTTANGGNPCWNYVGSPVGTGGHHRCDRNARSGCERESRTQLFRAAQGRHPERFAGLGAGRGGVQQRRG
jgi:hypothetical protein